MHVSLKTKLKHKMLLFVQGIKFKRVSKNTYIPFTPTQTGSCSVVKLSNCVRSHFRIQQEENGSIEHFMGSIL